MKLYSISEKFHLHIFTTFEAYHNSHLEIQYETKVSAYKPHQQTIKLFESARRFCFKYKALQNNNQIGIRLFRIINKMFDGFWE